MLCRICQNTTNIVIEKMILYKHRVHYFQCDSCGFLQTQSPHWLEEAYAEPMDRMDTGLLLRNISLSNICSVFIYFFMNPKKNFLDYAGGYGIFVRLMRDIGFDFYWEDPHTTNLLARGFEYHNNQPIELITAIECFEHFADPMTTIAELFNMSDTIFFTTELIPTNSSSILEMWPYLGPEHGQHVSFYSKKTLEHIATQFGCQFYTNNRNMHVLTRKDLKWFSFKMLYLLIKIKGSTYVKRQMKSKTQDDSRQIAQSNI